MDAKLLTPIALQLLGNMSHCGGQRSCRAFTAAFSQLLYNCMHKKLRTGEPLLKFSPNLRSCKTNIR
uniref:Uncharacterized protein n=1 Tax=Arundo donax TaxID=35708 RepID=A0A0A9EH62_ARUDO